MPFPSGSQRICKDRQADALRAIAQATAVMDILSDEGRYAEWARWHTSRQQWLDLLQAFCREARENWPEAHPHGVLNP